MSVAPERLQALFSRSELQRLIKRLYERREFGRSLTGMLTLNDATPTERRAVDQLLRRATTTGANLTVPLDALLQQLRNAHLADSWEEVLYVLCGPRDPGRLIAAEKIKAWKQLWDSALRSHSNESSIFVTWLEQLKRDGLLKRLSCDEPKAAQIWLSQAISLFHQLPLEDEPLANVAARVAGNSHALDPDSPLATIVLRGVALLYDCSTPTSAAERRELWSKAGIICDELSAPVLIFNLSLQRAYPLEELLDIGRNASVPLHLSTRLLLATDWSSAIAPPRVYVCENSSIVALVVRHLGAASAPLVCLDGEPKTAGWLLLRHLRDAGSEIWYHGDFDWAGVAIAGRVLARLNAKPWRYSTDDYLSAHGTEILRGSPVSTPWCPGLASALRGRRIAIHEEAVAELLLKDLQVTLDTDQSLGNRSLCNKA